MGIAVCAMAAFVEVHDFSWRDPGAPWLLLESSTTREFLVASVNLSAGSVTAFGELHDCTWQVARLLLVGPMIAFGEMVLWRAPRQLLASSMIALGKLRD